MSNHVSHKPHRTVGDCQTLRGPVGHMVYRHGMSNEPDGLTLSDLDRDIVAKLAVDGRQSYRQIARELQITEKSVRKRVADLLDRRVMTIAATSDPSALGFFAVASIALIVGEGHTVRGVVDRLKAFDAVDYIAATTGVHAVWAEMIAKNDDEMLTLLDENVRSIPGVASVEIFPVLWSTQRPDTFVREDEQKCPATIDRAQKGFVRKAQTDYTDRRIIHALAVDGRLPYSTLARDLGVSEATVRQRVKNLVAERLMRVTAIVDPFEQGYGVGALLAVRLHPGASLQPTVEEFTGHPSIIYGVLVAGRVDILVEVISEDRDQLLNIIDESVRSHPAVASCETHLYLETTYKQPQPWRRWTPQTH